MVMVDNFMIENNSVLLMEVVYKIIQLLFSIFMYTIQSSNVNQGGSSRSITLLQMIIPRLFNPIIQDF
jgi:hypothetical protein